LKDFSRVRLATSSPGHRCPSSLRMKDSAEDPLFPGRRQRMSILPFI
jgi:hypothetical protein